MGQESNNDYRKKPIMRQRVWGKSWGGRAEHGFRYFDVEITKSSLTVYLTVKDYTDWGGYSQAVAEYEKSLSFRIRHGRVTKDFLLECIKRTGEAFKETYLLPQTVDELDFSQ